MRTSRGAVAGAGGAGRHRWAVVAAGLARFPCVLLATAVAASPAVAQLSVQPVIVELRTSDSASAALVAVRSEADEAMQLRVYAADFDQPEEGSHRFLEPGTHPRSCAERLRFFPDDLVLAPGGEAEVRIELDPGASTCWSLVFVQGQGRETGGIRIAQRIGVKVYGVAGRTDPAGEIGAVAVREAGPGEREVRIAFRNTGDAPVRPEGELEVRTAEGDIVAVVPVPPFSVLPGRSRATTVPLGLRLDAGRYLAIPILDFGGDYLAGGQATFEVGG